MPLYEVAILELPTQKEKEEGFGEKLVMAPKPVIATDPQSAAVVAVMDEKVDVDRNRMKILVRPFE